MGAMGTSGQTVGARIGTVGANIGSWEEVLREFPSAVCSQGAQHRSYLPGTNFRKLL